MKKFLIAFLYYTRTERMGIITLCTTALLILFLPTLFPLFTTPQKVDFSAFKKALATLASERDTIQNKQLLGTLFKFDPNTVSLEELKQLGFSGATAQTIVNFRKKGGSFKKPVDLKKIYSLKDADYERVKNFIDIPGHHIAHLPDPENDKAEVQQATLFNFNPNLATAEELQNLGLTEKVVQTLLKFRSKGGQFYKKEDLQKVYGLSQADYQKLEPYVDLSNTNPSNPALAQAGIPSVLPVSYEEAPVVVDINRASLDDWQQLKGIGPGYAKRILDFREKLGGFASIEQVGETYHFPDSTFLAIKPFLRVSPIPHLIAINKVSEEQLQRHPYLNWKQAKAIISYRAQHGPFRSVEDLYQLYALPKEVIEKIAVYLSFE